ncbi:MAG TPA: DUF1674 domain-containing protein [Rhizomicrobium sp.]|nr:DUF1674 domain-containing protein [Rhizomicrobium sp.]
MAEISKSSSSAEVEKRIREAGERANAEAAARRAKATQGKPAPKEIGGQAGPDPTRFGDWEKNGIASDF